MLTEQEAQNLIQKLVELRTIAKETKNEKDILKLKQYENICVGKFSYLVLMKTARYKSFSNYEDLNQEGFEAMLKGFKNYNPEKGNIFWWLHRYIDTRISRSANLHTTIRYPLKFAKNTVPHKEAVLPLLIEDRYCPDKEFEQSQINHAIETAMAELTQEQKDIINLAFGFDGDKPLSINKICKQKNISRANCIKLINSSLIALKENIKL